MSKHTPGPWKVFAPAPSEGIDGWTIRYAGPDHRWHIATVYGNEITHTGPRHFKYTHGEAESNARLIAAAPDLLAALRKIEHQAIAGEGTLDENGTAVGAEDFEFIVNTARAAIAKAEGGAA